jgi:hypothetical protein
MTPTSFPDGPLSRWELAYPPSLGQSLQVEHPRKLRRLFVI